MKSTFLKIIYCIMLLIGLACSKEKTESTNDNATAPAEKETQAKVVLARDPRTIGPPKPAAQLQIEQNIFSINSAENPLYGYWVGAFGKNKINIAIAKVEGDSIFGHSVCAGNFRAIKGTVAASGDLYEVVMREPGDDKYDGEFRFTINLATQELTGSWKPYKKTASPKNYTLNRRSFSYDETAGAHPEGSTQWLEVPDVENLLPEEIELIRNEIYARHGYSFTNLKMRRAFDSLEWYIPMAVDIRDQLTETEAHNLDLLLNYENYYEEYYNDYGR